MSNDKCLREERGLPTSLMITDVPPSICFLWGLSQRLNLGLPTSGSPGVLIKMQTPGPSTGPTEADSPDRRSGNRHVQQTLWGSLILAKAGACCPRGVYEPWQNHVSYALYDFSTNPVLCGLNPCGLNYLALRTKLPSKAPLYSRIRKPAFRGSPVLSERNRALAESFPV